MGLRRGLSRLDLIPWAHGFTGCSPLRGRALWRERFLPDARAGIYRSVDELPQDVRDSLKK